MTLSELLSGYQGPRTLEDARAWLEEEITVADETPVTSRGIMARLAVEDSTIVFSVLRAASAQNALVAEALEMLRLSGLDFSHPNMQGTIDALFSGTPGLPDRVKALGKKTIRRWQQTDLPRLKAGYILEAL